MFKKVCRKTLKWGRPNFWPLSPIPKEINADDILRMDAYPCCLSACLLLFLCPEAIQYNTLPDASDWRPGGRGSNPRRGRQHSFVEIDQEIFSTVILSLSLIQEGQLSVSGERMCTILVSLATRPIYKYVCHVLFTYYCLFFHLHSTFWFNV